MKTPEAEYCETDYTPDDYLQMLIDEACVWQDIPKGVRTEAFTLNMIDKVDRFLPYLELEEYTPAVCQAAVEKDGWLIEDIPSICLTEAMKIDAVKHNGWVLRHIPVFQRTLSVVFEALRESISVAEFATFKSRESLVDKVQTYNAILKEWTLNEESQVILLRNFIIGIGMHIDSEAEPVSPEIYDSILTVVEKAESYQIPV